MDPVVSACQSFSDYGWRHVGLLSFAAPAVAIVFPMLFAYIGWPRGIKRILIVLILSACAIWTLNFAASAGKSGRQSQQTNTYSTYR